MRSNLAFQNGPQDHPSGTSRAHSEAFQMLQVKCRCLPIVEKRARRHCHSRRLASSPATFPGPSARRPAPITIPSHHQSPLATGRARICYSAKSMAALLKRTYSGLLALCLSLLCLCGGLGVRAQQASVAPPSTDSKPANDADFIAAADEVLNQMSQITGLRLRAPLKKSLRSRDEIRAFVVKQMNKIRIPPNAMPAHAAPKLSV